MGLLDRQSALEHKDSMGTGSVIRPGEVQMMSAGSGITHGEFNFSAEEGVHFLQIWIVPDRVRVAPRYQQKNFSAAEKRGRLRLIIAADGADGSLGVYQDARVHAGLRALLTNAADHWPARRRRVSPSRASAIAPARRRRN